MHTKLNLAPHFRLLQLLEHCFKLKFIEYAISMNIFVIRIKFIFLTQYYQHSTQIIKGLN